LNVGYKKFISQNDWFSIEMPIDWDEYVDTPEVEGTYAFFNTKEWTGNFRITPLKITSDEKNNAVRKNVAAEYVREMRNKNTEYLLFKVRDFDCTFYKAYSKGEDYDDVIYFWNLGVGCDLIICSFTIYKKMEGTEKTEMELKNTINKMLESIKIL